MALSPINEISNHLCRQLGLSSDLTLLERAWETEIGGMATMAWIVALDREILVVEANSSVAMQELTLQRRELLRRLNRHFPKPFLKALTVRISHYGHQSTR